MPCVFCGNAATVGGQLFSRAWLESLVAPQQRFVAARRTARELPGEERPLDSTAGNRELDVAVHCTCARCANGWIDHLDDKVQPLLASMNAADTLTVRITEQMAIAGWVAKAAVLIGCLDRATPVSFSEADLLRLRGDQIPPERAAVWVAGTKNIAADPVGSVHYSYLAPATAVSADSPAPLSQAHSFSPGRDDDHMYLVSFRIQHLAFQFFLPNESPDLFPARATGFDRVLTPIWPINLRPLTWPPATALDGADRFRALAESFATTTQPRSRDFPLS